MPLACKLLTIIAFLPHSAQVWGQESSALRGASDPKPEQVLVFDAGSSGTRIHVFNILPGTKESLVPRIDLAVRDKQTKKIKPGLSSFAENNDFGGAERNIEQLLEFASQFVPEDRRSSTPALLKATAGLRAVKPAEKAEAILQRVRETLKKSGYLFRMAWADIIKGKEEAALAWVAANYLKGNFDKASATTSSLGVIEMGGGSTQVTFEVLPKEASTVNESDNFVFKTLAGKSYYLYAHSYLGFGQDHAQARLKSSLPSTESEDPCYPAGYVRPAADDPGRLVKGTGNSEACQTLIKFFLLDQGDNTAPGRYPALSLRGHFVATENFFYVRNDFELPLDGSITAMKDAAKNGCERPLNPSVELEAAMKAGTADPLKQKGCFGLSYQAVLMDALKAPVLPGVEVQIARNINGGDIDWALGAALVHFIDSKNGPNADANAQLSISDVPIVSIVLVVFAIAAVLATVRCCLGPKCSKQVAAVSSVVRATMIGRSWIELTNGTKQPGQPLD